MRLSDSGFYSVTGSGGTSFAVRLNPGHAIYKAHFPDFPITPGVVLVEIACELAESFTDKAPVLRRVESVKFRSPVIPDGEMQVTYNFSNSFSPGALSSNVSVVSAGGRVLCSMSLDFSL